ncbi:MULTISPECIES: hypothetical protein [Vibrio]|uniref:hypothetical protein n=1 Tax=Vibrio TaxID=662 RepID=UPI001E4B957A|nr:hypothetical protein [Vibrio lentus]MCC4837959.1 hypothetical protein [Vibrio lentus]
MEIKKHIDPKAIESLASIFGVDYKVSRLSSKKQKAIIMEWEILSQIKPILDICTLKITDQKDKQVRAFWTDLQKQLSRGVEPKALDDYLDKKSANIIRTGLETSNVTKALGIALQSYSDGKNIVLELTLKAVAPILACMFFMVVSHLTIDGFTDSINRVGSDKMPPAVVVGYVINQYLVNWGVLTVLGLVLFKLMVIVGLNVWVDPLRYELSHKTFLLKLYRYNYTASLFKQLLMLRTAGMTIHESIAKIRASTEPFGKTLLFDIEVKNKRGTSPYAAICESKFLDEEDRKLLLDTNESSSNFEFKGLDLMISQNTYKYDALFKKVSMFYNALWFLILGVMLVATVGGQTLAQMTAARVMM